MDTDKKNLIFFPRISLYKLSEKLSKKAIVKLIESKVNNPDWVGHFKVVVDRDDFVYIKFESRDNGLYAKCKIDDYPTQSIQFISDLEKCFHLKLCDQNGDDFMHILSFIDKSDANEFKSVLKSYFKNQKVYPLRSEKPSLDMLKAQQEQRLLSSSAASKFIELYIKELTTLKPLTIDGYDKIYDNFLKLHQDACNLINGAKPEDLVKKMCTPMEQCIPSGSQKDNQRKRNVNEITIIAEDDKENEDNTDAAVPQAKQAKIKKGSKKNVLKEQKQNMKDKNNNNDNIENEIIEIVEIKDSKNSQPTKKQRLSVDSSSESEHAPVETEKVKTKKKPQRAAKAKAKAKISKSKDSSESTSSQSVAQLPIPQEQPKQQQQQQQQQNLLTKTPVANRFRIETLMESTSKPLKSEQIRPVTRANGKVKEAVQKFEQMRSQTETTSVPPTPSVLASAKKPLNLNESSQRVLRINPSKIRSSIDKRKLRTSQAKREIKRKSVKKVNAFVKAATDLNSTTVKQQANTTITSSNNNVLASTTIADQTINEEDSAKSERRLTRDILSSAMVQQQYRVATNLKTNNPERKKSFIQFLDRNTPMKMSKTELEEKRKIELQYKVKKEEERLHEREKQQKEKIEHSKKKREEKMKKIIESKAKRQEEELKRREEYEAKVKEIEENKKRLAEEKKREEQEKLKVREQRLAEEKRKQEEQMMHSKLAYSHNTSNLHGSAMKPKQTESKFHLPPIAPSQHLANTLNDKSKPVVLLNKMTNIPQKPLETTYVLNTPGTENMAPKVFAKPTTNLATKLFNSSLYNQFSSNPKYVNYPATPLAEPRLKDADNYDVSNLKSDDETDDEEEPSKPIPDWARDENIKRKARAQFLKAVNYTKVFRAASNCEIKLDEIFRTKRKKFNERSSSANWSSPPIWHTGLNGEESFRKFHFK